MENIKWRLRNTEDRMTRSNIHLMGVQEGRTEIMGRSNIEIIMVENFLELMKDIPPHIQKEQ